MLAGADDQAEATLSELLPVIDGSDINVSILRTCLSSNYS